MIKGDNKLNFNLLDFKVNKVPDEFNQYFAKFEGITSNLRILITQVNSKESLLFFGREGGRPCHFFEKKHKQSHIFST